MNCHSPYIYTILSVTIRTVAVHASANDVNLFLVGYDSMAGASGQSIQIASHTATLKNTFVFNDKFSFFGYEPSSNTQIARAEQGSNTPQYLKLETAASDCRVDVTVTYIDQDWS